MHVRDGTSIFLDLYSSHVRIHQVRRLSILTNVETEIRSSRLLNCSPSSIDYSSYKKEGRLSTSEN